MIVKVRILGYLRRYCKQDSLKEFNSAVPENSIVRDLLESLGIPKEEEMILTINGVYKIILTINDIHNPKGDEIELKENDTIWIMPMIAGG